MKNLLLAATIAIAGTGVSSMANAEGTLSANIGVVSEYHFRGVLQEDFVASAGLDYENSGFYAGTWAADVKDGLEVDGYFGYGITRGDFTASLGFTGYYYTGDFDDTYEEINLNLGYAGLSFEYSVGNYENFGGPELDYDFTALTYEQQGFYGTYGTFGGDSDGDYFEFGYGMVISGIDFGAALIVADDRLAGGSDDESLIFSIGKTFDL